MPHMAGAYQLCRHIQPMAATCRCHTSICMRPVMLRCSCCCLLCLSRFAAAVAVDERTQPDSVDGLQCYLIVALTSSSEAASSNTTCFIGLPLAAVILRYTRQQARHNNYKL
jgi:hypothetical protein